MTVRRLMACSGALLIAALPAFAQDTLCESFEAGVPGYWQASRPGSLSVSRAHAKHGAYSLRWDWQAGETLRVAHGIGDPGRVGGYGGAYSKATFGIWVYCETPMEGALRLEIRAGESPGGYFEFPLDFTGWRRAHLWFGRDFEGRVPANADTIVISAPEAPERGTVFIDLVVYNGLMDYRQQCVPKAGAWQPPSPDPERFPVPEQVSEAEARGAEKVGQWFDRQLASGGSVGDAQMDTIAGRVAQWGIVRENGSIRGRGVVPNPGYSGEHLAEPPASPGACADLMLEVGRLYHRSTDASQRERLAGWFLDLWDNLHDQGMQAGSGFGWGGYGGRSLGDALYLMRGVLEEGGRLVEAARYFDYCHGFSAIFDDASIAPHMDHFHITTRYQLYGALMQPTVPLRVRALKAYSRRLSLEILHEGPNGFKPDGAAFHHNMHYFAYASYSMNSLTNVLEGLRGTPYQVTGDALAQVKRVLLSMRFYCNRTDLPLSMQGRHPFDGQAVPVGAILSLARCGSPDGSKALDPELAAAYLRFRPDQATQEPFASAGIQPEPEPRGNLCLNYAVIMAHRRENWMALVRAYNRNFLATEIYAKENRFGRYHGNGALEILGGGDPVSRAGSGYAHEGWDWNRLDGTTVIYLPLDRLRAVSSGTEFISTDELFSGGLSHRGRNGCFVATLHGNKNHDPTFRAKKSTFLFDDRIVCLGSGIENTDSEHPTHTNLFQKHLAGPDVPIVVNGDRVAGLGVEGELPGAAPGWLLDTQNTGYYLPAGQRVRYARKRQKSRDQSDSKDTEGDFACAWIDHGTAPSGEQYEYAAIVRATPERMEGFARDMSDPERAPYRVERKDSGAHIVYDRATATRAFVLFEAGEVQGGHPLAAVDHPCLVMLESDGDGYHLSLCDPDVNLVEGVSQPRQITLSLRGAWRVEGAEGSPEVLETAGQRTLMRFTCHQGKSISATLVPAG